MKRKIQALGVLLLMGAVKLPLEQRVTARLRAEHLIDEPVAAGKMQLMGQTGLTALLGGLRGLVASMLQLRAHVEFKRVNWAQVDSLYRVITLLQPRVERYWDDAAWHMAYNAAGHYHYRTDLPNELKGQLRERHVKRGIDILLEGLAIRPDSARLWERLAEIYFRRSYEYKKAGDAFWQAFQHGGPGFTLHFAGFAYARASDAESWRKAYDILKGEYDRKRSTPGLVQHLKEVEQYLGIPAEKRIPDAAPAPKMPQNLPGPRR
jgi:hypothetical protein